jgi:hypothetical protein
MRVTANAYTAIQKLSNSPGPGSGITKTWEKRDMSDQEKIQNYMGSQSPRWNNWVRPEGIDTLEKMGFYDSSWGDDACPSWTHDGVDLVVYVDLPVEFSEIQSGSPAYKQYILNHDSEPGDTILMTNDAAEIEAYIKDQHCITLDGQHVCKVNPCACYCHH